MTASLSNKQAKLIEELIYSLDLLLSNNPSKKKDALYRSENLLMMLEEESGFLSDKDLYVLEDEYHGIDVCFGLAKEPKYTFNSEQTLRIHSRKERMKNILKKYLSLPVQSEGSYAWPFEEYK